MQGLSEQVLVLRLLTIHSKLLNKAAVGTEMLVAFYTTGHGFYHVARRYSAALFEHVLYNFFFPFPFVILHEATHDTCFTELCNSHLMCCSRKLLWPW